jgi:hypothetical protein
MENETKPFPAALTVEYSPKSDRLTALFRLIAAIPFGILAFLLMGPSGVTSGNGSPSNVAYGGGFVFLPTLLMIVFRQKYPRWWFDWNLNLMRLFTRFSAYLLLLRDEYPSTDEEQAVRLELTYPDAKNDLNRWLPLVKWLLALPHYFCLFFLGLAAFVFTLVAWFAILLTGTYPQSLFQLVVGVMRWNLRVSAYAFLLTTDRYPPFRLKE